jgi:hypothetical protein
MIDHGSRTERLARKLADARDRAAAARNTGDHDGYRYAAAEYKRLRLALAEG